MKNVCFSYLYRDGSNYKKWGEVIFSNPDDVSLEDASSQLGNAFSEGIFIAHQIRVPELFLTPEYEPTEDDHCFHEFDSVSFTSAKANDPNRRSLRTFVAEVVRESLRGWKAFDPLERLTTHKH